MIFRASPGKVRLWNHRFVSRCVRAGEVNKERNSFDAAIDEILATAAGDVRRALRAVLVENVQSEAELRRLYAMAAHGNAEHLGGSNRCAVQN